MTDSTFCGNLPDHIDGEYVDGGGNVFEDECPDASPWEIAPPGGDGMVSSSDLLQVLGNWHQAGLGDFNGDGIINVIDLLDLLGHWGPCPV